MISPQQVDLLIQILLRIAEAMERIADAAEAETKADD
jgi:hypothetical protein